MPTGRTRHTLLLAAVAVCITASSALAGNPPRRIVFPVVGKVTYTNDFGAPRPQGRHEGNDLMGTRWQLVIAAEAGKVQKWSQPGRTGLCMLYLYGRSGTTYVYVHLNNDKTNHNDNTGGCRNGISWAPGLRSGQAVRAGQLLGYVGDSGDANGIQPHLHFELHPHGGRAVSPYRWLRRARHVLYATRSSTETVWLKLFGTVRSTSPRLDVHVNRVYASSKRWTRVTKNVALDVADNVVVERRTASGSYTAYRMSRLKPGDRVRVRTKRAPVSLTTQLGKPGALDAWRVYYLPN